MYWLNIFSLDPCCHRHVCTQLILLSWRNLTWKDRTIAACRAVIRLLEFGSSEVYSLSMSAVENTNPVPHSIVQYARPKSKSQKYTPTSKRAEIHVTTENIAMAEFPWAISLVARGKLIALMTLPAEHLALIHHIARTIVTKHRPSIWNLRGTRRFIRLKKTRSRLLSSQEELPSKIYFFIRKMRNFL